MSGEKESPFVPGARVAIQTLGYGPSKYTEAWVDKVYKNGNFTLAGNPKQQWKPMSYRNLGEPQVIRWNAQPTGSIWVGMSVLFWDEVTEAEVSAGIATSKRGTRLSNIKVKIGKLILADVTDDFLGRVEAALDELDRPKEQEP